MDHVSSLHSTPLSLLMWVVANGIGIIKFASSAQMDGLSMTIKCAFLSMTNANLGIQLELVRLASRDMI